MPEADAVISKGMQGERIAAPAVERVIGSEIVEFYNGKRCNVREAFTLVDSDYYASEWAKDINNMVGKAY